MKNLVKIFLGFIMTFGVTGCGVEKSLGINDNSHENDNVVDINEPEITESSNEDNSTVIENIQTFIRHYKEYENKEIYISGLYVNGNIVDITDFSYSVKLNLAGDLSKFKDTIKNYDLIQVKAKVKINDNNPILDVTDIGYLGAEKENKWSNSVLLTSDNYEQELSEYYGKEFECTIVVTDYKNTAVMIETGLCLSHDMYYYPGEIYHILFEVTEYDASTGDLNIRVIENIKY